MKIQESAENYLETILVLKKKNGVVRSIDIANDLGVSKPSVSVAMKNLRNGEYIEMDKEGAGQSFIRLSGYMRDKIQFSERNYFTSKNPPSACIVMLTSSFFFNVISSA